MESKSKPLLVAAILFCFLSAVLHLNAEPVSFEQTSCGTNEHECIIRENANQGYEENSPKCNHFGTYKGGVCECHPSFFGRRCECKEGYIHVDTPACIPPDSIGSTVCSGRGNCICNQCECDLRENANEIVSGKWCECDNFSCHRHGGEICGGHGVCACGLCICNTHWTGYACENLHATNQSA